MLGTFVAVAASAVLSSSIFASSHAPSLAALPAEETATAPACVATDLSAVAQVALTSTYTSHTLGGSIVYTNVSSQVCTLQGVPSVQIVDTTGAPLPVTQQEGVTLPPSAPPATLRAGEKAFSPIAWTNFCVQPPPPGPYSLKVTLPNGGTLAAPFSPAPPFSAVPPGPPCESPGSPSVIFVGSLQAFVPHDSRYFPQTAYRIDNDVIWDYFTRRGGVNTFGYPISRTFRFQGFPVQFFQRRIVQIGPDGHARLLNALDPGLMPFDSFNRAIMPGFDRVLVSTAPSPADATATFAWVRAHAPDSFQGLTVNFYRTFANTVSYATAFPNGGDARLLAGFDLELWGIPTSSPQFDPNNHNFVYLRFQRGIMHYDATCNCTRGILLADYLKDILTGNNLPADLDQEARGSPFYKQYDPGAFNWVRTPALLPNTDLTHAFDPE